MKHIWSSLYADHHFSKGRLVLWQVNADNFVIFVNMFLFLQF